MSTAVLIGVNTIDLAGNQSYLGSSFGSVVLGWEGHGTAVLIGMNTIDLAGNQSYMGSSFGSELLVGEGNG
jgi:hypothetical protein